MSGWNRFHELPQIKVRGAMRMADRFGVIGGQRVGDGNARAPN